MQVRPKLVVFDIFETVISLEPLRARFEALGAAGALLETWFAAGLRDAFAIACTGGFRPFAEVLEGALDQILDAPTAERKAHIMEGFAELTPHPDARAAFRTLVEAGYRIAALSNGAVATTRTLLSKAGLEKFFERIGSVDDVKASKPKPQVYLKLLETCGVAPPDACLVAAHAWDVNGAKAAGLRGLFVARGRKYPGSMTPPDLLAQNLGEAAAVLVAMPARQTGPSP